MSSMSEKLESDRPSCGLARCWLKKHLTYKDGSKAYRVLESLNGKPLKIEVARMNIKETWRYVMSKDGDHLFEKES